MVSFAWWPNPFTFLVGVMVIGGRQLGLAILMHDAAHGLLFADRRLNDWFGSWLCALPVFTILALYRPYHLQHHRFTSVVAWVRPMRRCHSGLPTCGARRRVRFR